MKLFNMSLSTMMFRFYLMMAIVIVPIFAGVPVLAILALPIFLFALLGIQFSFPAWFARKTQATASRKTALEGTHQPVH